MDDLDLFAQPLEIGLEPDPERSDTERVKAPILAQTPEPPPQEEPEAGTEGPLVLDQPSNGSEGRGGQLSILEEPEWWGEDWQDMPEFIQNDLTSYRSLIVHFATPEDLAEFSRVVDQALTYNTRSIWFPRAEIGRLVDKRYVDESIGEEPELP